MRHSKIVSSLLLMAAAVLVLDRSASAQIPFQLTGQVGSNIQALDNGATVNLAASGVGQSTQLLLTATYTGAGTAQLNTPQTAGSSAFSITQTSQSSTLGSGQAATYTIVFTASSGSEASATITVGYTETVGKNSDTGNIALLVTGSAPTYSLGYAIQPNGNAISVSNGGAITFPSTVVGSTATAEFTIDNTGAGAGTLTSVTVTGSAFNTVSLPLLPGTIGAGQQFQFQIVYSPKASEADTGSLQLVLGNQTINISLAGTGIASQLTLQLTSGGQTLTVNQNQVTLPSTQLGTTTTISVTAMNAGNASTTINGINLSGSGFQLISVPPLPQTLAPNGTLNFTLGFTPPSANTFTGYLAIGGVTLTMTATGLGPLYQYSYTSGTSTSSVSPGGIVFFPTTPLSQSSSSTFTITNTGTASGTISGIYIAQPNAPFTITGLPSLPFTLSPNQPVSFTINFTPVATGAAGATLQVDAVAFNLSGAGGQAPPFPNYTLTGPTGTLGPLQQPSISLTLSAPYALAVTGTLTMTVTPNGFTADPAIQFSTGGKTVTFTIAANSTSAQFPNGSNSIELQTGSTAGTITLTPTFQTSSGVALTTTTTPLQLVVPATAPLLIGAQVGAQSLTGFTIAISGVTNSQNLTELDFDFTAASGYTLSGGSAKVPVSGPASAWFASAGSEGFGGQFVATIPFTLTTNGSTSTTTTAANSPVPAVTSVSITAVNAQGTSSPLVVPLP